MLEEQRFALSDALVETTWGFDLAPSETALASRESRGGAADEFILKRQLSGLGGYDVAIIDCPPSLGLLSSTRSPALRGW
jgi:chromosome partitioning protein